MTAPVQIFAIGDSRSNVLPQLMWTACWRSQQQMKCREVKFRPQHGTVSYFFNEELPKSVPFMGNYNYLCSCGTSFLPFFVACNGRWTVCAHISTTHEVSSCSSSRYFFVQCMSCKKCTFIYKNFNVGASMPLATLIDKRSCCRRTSGNARPLLGSCLKGTHTNKSRQIMVLSFLWCVKAEMMCNWGLKGGTG